MNPETKYVRSGDVDIAYVVNGDGPIDLVSIPGWIFSIDSFFDEPTMRYFIDRLQSFSRGIVFDKRGIGLSDRVTGVPPLEDFADDLRAVMDAAGSQRAALWGHLDGGVLAVLFAATYPERTEALILYGFTPAFRTEGSASYPPDFLDMVQTMIEQSWGTGAFATLAAPTRADDPEFREWWARAERVAATPRTAAAFIRVISEIDVRHVLPAIRVPTLVITRPEAAVLPSPAVCRWVAEQIPGARYVELPGTDSLPMIGDADSVIDEVQEFLTGVRPAREADRVLATILFTDIVVSTERLTALGDKKWKGVLDQHDALVDRELARHRGRKIHTTGDGVLVTFDGPARAVRCACAIRDSLRALDIETRFGVHTGEIELRGDDVSGIAVHIGQRVSALAEPGEVLVSRTVTDLVAGSGLSFESRGEHELKGIPGRWQLFRAQG